jgi:kynurenine formamidase
MQLTTSLNGKKYTSDLKQGISLSLGFGPLAENPNAFHISPAVIEPIRVGDFVGSVQEGGSANCEVVTYCAHGNGTHTECVGHLTKERIHLPEILKTHFFTAQLITVPLIELNGDNVIDVDSFRGINFDKTDAIIIRTSPNNIEKKSMIWSGNNPPYFTVAAMQILVDAGFSHLLCDFPSVDREEDAGALAAHRIWWQYPQKTRMNATITELIYVEDHVLDGLYFLNLLVPKIHSDAVPSQPIIYPLMPIPS